MNRFSMIAALAAVALSAGAQSSRRLSVDQMFALLDENNSAIKVKRAATEVAQLGIDAAKSQRLPDVESSLSASYSGDIIMMDRDLSNVHTFSSPHIGNSFSISAQQVIYSGGAVTAGVSIAELQKQQADANMRLVVQQKRFTALGIYLDLYKLGNRMKVYEENIALTEQLIGNIQARHMEGMALTNDVTRYELQKQQLLLGLRKLQDEKSIINHHLCITLGITDEEIEVVPSALTIAKDADSNPTAAYREWCNTAIMASPDIQLSQLSTRIAEQNIKLARSEMLPKVAFVAADEFHGPITFEIPALDRNLNVWYVGIGVTYPVSSLFKSCKKVKQAEARLAETREQCNVVSEGVDVAVKQAYTEYQQSYVELSTQQKSVQLAQQNFLVVSDRYQNDMALITDMIDASNVKLNAELLEVDARINIVYAYYKMKYVSGTL